MKKLVIVLFVVFLSGCASSVKGIRNSNFTDALKAFESLKDLPKTPILETEVEFHSIIYQDNPSISNSHKLKSSDYAGTKYLIGVEKFGKQVSDNGDLYNDHDTKQLFDKELICSPIKDLKKSPELCKQYDSVTDDPKPAFVSHIAKFKNSETSFIYNVYGSKDHCSNDGQDGNSCLLAGLQSLTEPTALQGDLLATIEKENPTHIIVMSTGWNTYQSESIDNYNEWINVIEKAAGSALGKEFRPLYIGFSWESTWGFLYDIGLGFISEPNKSNDADEVGLVTANVLVNKTLKPLTKQKGIKMVLIGHSFGTRITGHAAFSGHLIPENDLNRPITLFLGLQGAFSFRRFMSNDDDGLEGTPYRNTLTGANHVVMTNSDFDAANKQSLWTTYIGNSDVRSETSECCPGTFAQTSLKPNGELESPEVLQSNKVILVNADEVINMNKINTGGGAHSDVFNEEIGRFIWDLINR